ncbi:MAG: hsp90 co-chaperone Cdc37 [Chaenotheca gracillima]|nr:MAG: hsp90 co-chaperone Cdc37 [Chaenotheca gracillima]
MVLPGVHFSFPSGSLFQFPPASEPATLPTASSSFPYAPPFSIPSSVYNHLLSPVYPATISVLYLSAVISMNKYNRSHDRKPWSISQTRPFFWGVVLHNFLLALYSAWSLVGMITAVKHTWPGLYGKDGLVGAVDSMCKLHGPRGLGDAITYNTTTNSWSAASQAIKLVDTALPDSTDVGRLWNEGLAFYGWIFYVSKYYEVLDTVIVLAKGKTSSVLQTYHHAGAILCVWAGIRYMSPPIWMFVMVNSGIHMMMYTYYTLSAFSLPIPVAIKRTITTLQIVQFLVGASYAALHLFISYDSPVSVPYTIVSSVTAAASSVTSAAASAATSASIGGWLKKFALRAAGEEGLAENVPGAGDLHVLEGLVNTTAETGWRTELRTVPCIDTSGEAFAIWLNVLYLAPLTYLFSSFFARSYSRRSAAKEKSKSSDKVSTTWEKAGVDALKGVDRELNETPVPERSS